VNPPLVPQPRPRRTRVRSQARLDAQTHATREALTTTFRRKRAPILRYVMRWGRSHSGGWTIDEFLPAAVHLVHVLVEPALLQHVQTGAGHHKVRAAVGLRQALRLITPEDFPPGRRAGETASRSHDSGHDQRRFMLRFDGATSDKLATLAQAFDRPAAEVLCQRIIQAMVAAFPQSWHLAVAERRR
jgi:hypothetical protein